MVGAGAALVLPAERVYLSRAAFPPMKERDLRDAVGMELERLFPVPSADAAPRVPAARPAFPRGKDLPRRRGDPLGIHHRWEEIVARAGLSLSAAVPAAWAVAPRYRDRAGCRVNLAHRGRAPRGGAAVECTLFASGEPFFCASAPCSPGSALEEGLSLARAGFVDPPSSAGEGPVDLYAPQGWCGKGAREIEDGGVVFRVGAFDRSAASALTGAGMGESGPAPDPFPFPWRIRGRARRGTDGPALPSAGRVRLGDLPGDPCRGRRGRPGPRDRLALRRRLEGEGGASQAGCAGRRASPLRERYEETFLDLADAQGRIAALREEASSSGEALQILREMTDRLPMDLLLALQLEGRKVDIDGVSRSASEIFPALTHDGRFRSVEFGAPITRQADNIERFKIRGEFVRSRPPLLPSRRERCDERG